MRIERANPYSQRLTGRPKKAGAEPELSGAGKSLPDGKIMEKRISEQEKLKNAIEQMKYEQQKIKQAEESMRAAQEEAKVLTTCLEISRRIINGDKVPQKDHKYLMEHNMELYAKSIMMRRHKEDPREYDQLSEDEESNTPQSAMDAQISSGSESSAPVPKPDVSI